MKTKELIEHLQKVDPSGQLIVCLPSGDIPLFAMVNPGYWDGHYEYIDGDTWVHTVKGYKLIIVGKDKYDFIEENENLSWEELKAKIRIEFDDYSNPESRNEKTKQVLDVWKKVYDEWHSYH
jgi:hypothetical protein